MRAGFWRPSDRTLRALAWVIFIACVALVAATVVIVTRGGPNPLPRAIGDQFEELVAMLFQLAFPLVGVLIVTNRPRNAVGWLLLFPPAMLLLTNAAASYAAQALIVAPGSLPFGAFMSWIGWLWPMTLAALVVLLLVYPDGTLLSPRWRWVAWGSVIAGVGVAVGAAIVSWPHRGRTLLFAIEDQIPELRWGYVVVTAFVWLILTALGAAFVSLVLRYRRSGREERLQIKWLAAAVALLVVDAVLSVAFPMETTWRYVISDVVFALVPVAIGIAVLKYKLYEIEVIINRTLVYVPLVAIVGGLATAMIPLSQRVFMALTGNTSDAAIVLTTLFVASLVTPVRKRLESAVEGRFRPGRAERGAHGDGQGAHLMEDPEVEARMRSIAESVVLDALERRTKGGD